MRGQGLAQGPTARKWQARLRSFCSEFLRLPRRVLKNWQVLNNRKQNKHHMPCAGRTENGMEALHRVTPKRTESGASKRYLRTLFTAALFTTSKRWKQHSHPPAGEWINSNWHTHCGLLFSFRKVGNPGICCNMDELQRHYAK